MRYFTKEWLRLHQESFYHDEFFFTTDDRAEMFSENYYLELIEYKLNGIRFKTAEEKQGYLDFILELSENDITDFKQNLPMEILEEVADLRVMSFRVVSPKVLKMIQEFSQSNRRIAEAIKKEYDNYYKKLVNGNHSALIRKLHFHDFDLYALSDTDNKLKMEMRYDTPELKIFKTVEFINYEILHIDDEAIGKWWKLEEVYIDDYCYELHGLLNDHVSHSSNDNIYEVIIKSKDIIVYETVQTFEII